jgi:negative regulator of flagellin synthesis FlgM
MTDTTINISSYQARFAQTEATAPAQQPAGHTTTPIAIVDKNATALAIKTDQSTASGSIGTALSGSDVRTEKVASLQKAIASGTYHVPSADVAGKLLQSLLGE